MLDMGGRSVKRRQQIEKCLQREAAEHLEHDRLGGNASKCQHHESPQSWKVVGIIPQLPYFRLSLITACKSACKRATAGGPGPRAKSFGLWQASSVLGSAPRATRGGGAGGGRRMRMDAITSFGEWLRRARKACDLTQAELAQRVGCAEGTIRNLEADGLRPSKQLATRLAAQLG